jgi:hypothetical protein
MANRFDDFSKQLAAQSGGGMKLPGAALVGAALRALSSRRAVEASPYAGACAGYEGIDYLNCLHDAGVLARGGEPGAYKAPARAQFNAVSAVRFNAITPTRFNAMNSVRFNAIGSARFNAVSSPRFNAIGSARFNAVSSVRFNALAPARFNAVNPVRFNAMTREAGEVRRPVAFNQVSSVRRPVLTRTGPSN